jgi:hypothetical protein
LSLITVNADFRELVQVLREIRDVLVRAFPDRSAAKNAKPAGPENLTEVDYEQIWEEERKEEERLTGRG